MTTTKTPDIMTALAEHLEGKQVELDGRMGSIKVAWPVCEPWRSPRISHEPDGIEPWECAITDLTWSDRLIPLALELGFDASPWERAA